MAKATGVALPQIRWMRSRNEPCDGSCHPKLLLAMSGEPIQPAPSCHETAIFELPQRCKERAVTHSPCESSRVRVTLHQSEQACFEHASP
jgi:hypothetical protein